MLSMITPPFKTSAEFKLVRPVGQWVSDHYFGSSNDPEVMQTSNSALEDIFRLRNMTVRSVYAVRVNEAFITDMTKYYSICGHLDRRIKSEPVHSNDKHFKITWFDAFQSKYNIDIHDFAREQVFVLYNIAVANAQLAAALDITTGEGLKASCQKLQQAAGVFQYLRTSMGRLVGLEVTVDMVPDVLQMLEHVCLAQAQECFYAKACLDQMKPILIAKLALQVSLIYEIAWRHYSVKMVKEHVPEAWGDHIRFRVILFKILAQHQQAIHLHTASKIPIIGEELARLHLCVEWLKEAAAVKQTALDVQYLARIKEAIMTQLSQGTTDNDTIYHAQLTKYKELAEIEGKQVVKSILPEFAALKVTDPLAHLVPTAIKESAMLYAGQVKSTISQVEELIDQLGAKLGAVNVPFPSDLNKNGVATEHGIPEKLWSKVETIQRQGGTAPLYTLKDTIRDMSAYSAELLNEIDVKIKEEENLDSRMSSKYASDWKRMPSRTVNKQYFETLSTRKVNLVDASKADGKIVSSFTSKEASLRMLDQSKEAIQKTMPDVNISYTQAELTQLEVMRAEYANINDEKLLLGKYIIDMNNMKADEDIVVLLTSAKGSEISAEQCRQNALAKYQNLLEECQIKVNRFMQQLETMETEINTLQMRGGSVDLRVKAKEAVIANLQNSVQDYNDVTKMLNQGIDFHTNFQDVLGKLNSEVDNFIAARAAEASDLESQLTSEKKRLTDREAQLKADRDFAEALNREGSGGAAAVAVPSIVGARPGGPGAQNNSVVMPNVSGLSLKNNQGVNPSVSSMNSLPPAPNKAPPGEFPKPASLPAEPPSYGGNSSSYGPPPQSNHPSQPPQPSGPSQSYGGGGGGGGGGYQTHQLQQPSWNASSQSGQQQQWNGPPPSQTQSSNNFPQSAPPSAPPSYPGSGGGGGGHSFQQQPPWGGQQQAGPSTSSNNSPAGWSGPPQGPDQHAYVGGGPSGGYQNQGPSNRQNQSPSNQSWGNSTNNYQQPSSQWGSGSSQSGPPPSWNAGPAPGGPPTSWNSGPSQAPPSGPPQSWNSGPSHASSSQWNNAGPQAPPQHWGPGGSSQSASSQWNTGPSQGHSQQWGSGPSQPPPQQWSNSGPSQAPSQPQWNQSSSQQPWVNSSTPPYQGGQQTVSFPDGRVSQVPAYQPPQQYAQQQPPPGGW